MRKKNLIFFAVFLAISASLMPPSWKWILVHGLQASNYAKKLLAGNAAPKDDSFINYVIYTEGECVVFSEHDSKNSIIYCASEKPYHFEGLASSKHIIGGWYEVVDM